MFRQDIAVHSKPIAQPSIQQEGRQEAVVDQQFVELVQVLLVGELGQLPQVVGRGFEPHHTLSSPLNHELEPC